MISDPVSSDPASRPWSGDGIAQLDPKGFYASLGVGVSWPQPVEFSDGRLGPALPIQGTVLINPGVATDLGLGYDFGALRGELSWVQRQAWIQSSSWSVGPLRAKADTGDGHVRSNSLLASLYLDFAQRDSRLVPYLGGGLGYTSLQGSPTTLRLRRTTAVFGGGGGGVLGYQAKAGLAYRSSPRTDLFGEVVFQGSPGRSQDTLERGALSNWGFRLGLRYRLGEFR